MYTQFSSILFVTKTTKELRMKLYFIPQYFLQQN